MYLLGFDIGGTKCAVVTAHWDGEAITPLKKARCATDLTVTPEAMLDRLIAMADEILEHAPDRVGISCGGPLDSSRGIILGPPNLPGWEHVPIVQRLQSHYGAPTHLQNDANACAVAEWKFGAGRGADNLIFLTFGTGLGAGLILGGRLYDGTNGNAGEAGHLRLSPHGPVGYGKEGSFEGFCSGSGIAQLAWTMAQETVRETGRTPLYLAAGMTEQDVSAKTVAEAALAGDETALAVYRRSGEYLGKGLSILIDLLNPQVIVIGSIFARSEQLLRDAMQRELEKETLSPSLSCCRIVPAMLGESIGDLAALATALL